MNDVIEVNPSQAYRPLDGYITAKQAARVYSKRSPNTFYIAHKQGRLKDVQIIGVEGSGQLVLFSKKEIEEALRDGRMQSSPYARYHRRKDKRANKRAVVAQEASSSPKRRRAPQHFLADIPNLREVAHAVMAGEKTLRQIAAERGIAEDTIYNLSRQLQKEGWDASTSRKKHLKETLRALVAEFEKKPAQEMSRVG